MTFIQGATCDIVYTTHATQVFFFDENLMNTASRTKSAREQQDTAGVEQDKVTRIVVIFMFSSLKVRMNLL